MAAVLLALALLASLPAQDPDAEAPAARGWALSNESGALRWTTRAANAAFLLGPDEALDPRSAAGVGAAVWEGDVELARLGDYSFEALAEGGRATLELFGSDGKPLAQPVDGRAGRVRLRLRFEPQPGPRRLQLRWKLANSPQGDFASEPLPARVVALPAELAEAAQAGERALAGRVLLEEKGCTNCHLPSEAMARSVGRRRAPLLGEEAYGVDWLARWVSDPAALRPGADMPALALALDEQQAIVQWLARGGVGAAALANEPAVLAPGRALYHSLGCIACHGALEPPADVLGSEYLARELPAVAPPAPFGDLAAKWQPASLSKFLRDPRVRRPDSRMPSFDLSEGEADLLATYLCARFGPAPAAAPAELRTPTAAVQCSSCHEIPGLESRPLALKSLGELDPSRGCLDPTDRSTPRYSLTDEQRAALRAGIAAVRLASGAPAPLDAAERTFQRLRCGACHARDGRDGLAEELRPYFVSSDERVDIGDEGRIPPDLSGVGFKLSTHWLGEVLAHSGRARPYLAARMPQFGAEALGPLARDLARREGVLPESDAREPVASDERLQAGRALMARGAHGCISCHLFKDAPSGGTPGPRLDQFAERLRYEWYAAYMPDPMRFKPGTKMPSFQTRGTSAVKNVLGGDARAQDEAMWCYFTLGSSMPPPPGLELDRRGLRVPVGERPVVLRAFLADVGPRAIAVGMPSGLHFAFDAGAARLADAWKGDFVDAGGAWSGRGGNELGGLGERVWTAPPGPLLALGGKDAPAARFEGYTLDAQGLPTFLWRLGEAWVHETIRTLLVPRPVLRRELRITGLVPGSTLWLNAGALEPQALGGARLARSGESATLEVLASAVTFTLEVLP
jgi:mono/diheme cytochrome c family protein